ncbi:MAG: nitroreductase family protein [Candidatus Heimdallarchaeota archaeon]|nr:nitroreductase family protein [Candidatus Heimdallarchaeota archaeon]
MMIENIDYQKCNNCGKCEKVCPSRLFEKLTEKDRHDKIYRLYAFNDPNDLCVKCGHCIAVCPQEAILYKDADAPFNFEGTKKLAEIVHYEDMIKILRMRRSMRVFKKEAVPKEKIEKVLEAMRYAPSASNRQNWRFTVITDRDEISYLSKETSKFFKTAKNMLPLKYLLAPFLNKGTRKRVLSPKTKIQLERGLERIRNGEDIIFFDAPSVILLSSREYTSGLAENDAGIAFTYGMLAAQALGLGTCWIGFAQRRLQNKRRLRKHFKIAEGFNVRGVLILGIPAVEYQRGPPRKTLQVNWFEKK